jgi:hypothetical protein
MTVCPAGGICQNCVLRTVDAAETVHTAEQFLREVLMLPLMLPTACAGVPLRACAAVPCVLSPTSAH